MTSKSNSSASARGLRGSPRARARAGLELDSPARSASADQPTGDESLVGREEGPIVKADNGQQYRLIYVHTDDYSGPALLELPRVDA
jgi:hypothetical protein